MITINFIKKNAMAIVAGIAFLGFSSFKLMEKNAAPQDGWYEVTPSSSNPTNESLQTIGSLLETAPPLEDENGCAQNNTGDRCAIHLTFKSSASTIPSTVDDARNDADVDQVGNDSKQP